MSIYGEAIWVSGSPSLMNLSTPLIKKISTTYEYFSMGIYSIC